MVNPRSPKQRAKPTSFLLALGAHCRRLRTQRGYSIDRLAKESDHLSTSVIQRLETGSGPVNVTNLLRYAAALDLRVQDLFTFDSKNTHEEPRRSSPEVLPVDTPGVEKLAYRTHLPLYSLKAAAGRFGTGETVEAIGWVEVKGRGALSKKMFVAQASGRSMEPKILDGDYLVFRLDPEGTRQGKIVLAQYRGPQDPETGGSYSVKVYASARVAGAKKSDFKKQVTLSPLNPDYEPMLLRPEREEDFRVVAELLFVL